MRENIRVVSLFVLVLCLPLAAQDDLPAGKGKETLENTCTECHGLDRVFSQLRSRERWRAITVSMRSKGATLSDGDLNTLVDYLFQHFGIVEINVNKAAAKELVSVLQLTPAEAEAIVRFRAANGPFKEWRDLTKVEGSTKQKSKRGKINLLSSTARLLQFHDNCFEGLITQILLLVFGPFAPGYLPGSMYLRIDFPIRAGDARILIGNVSDHPVEHVFVDRRAFVRADPDAHDSNLIVFELDSIVLRVHFYRVERRRGILPAGLPQLHFYDGDRRLRR